MGAHDEITSVSRAEMKERLENKELGSSGNRQENRWERTRG